MTEEKKLHGLTFDANQAVETTVTGLQAWCRYGSKSEKAQICLEVDGAILQSLRQHSDKIGFPMETLLRKVVSGTIDDLGKILMDKIETERPVPKW